MSDEPISTHSAAGNLSAEQSNSIGVKPNEATADFQINLNEFLKFLKLSCHVNDMIARSERPKDATTMTAHPLYAENVSGNSKRNKDPNRINFTKLANNPLVNELYGLKQTEKSSSQTNKNNSREDSRVSFANGDNKSRGNSTSFQKSEPPPAFRGLHPKLSEKLDYVINEGVMDSVLSFICPVPIPSPLTPAGRAKAKQQQHQQQQQQQQRDLLKPLSVVASSTSLLASCASNEMQQLTGDAAAAAAALPQSSTSQVNGATSLLKLNTPATSSTSLASSESNSVVRATVKDASSNKSLVSNSSVARRKSLLLMKDKNATVRQDRKEPEVIIHVCDEVKNTSRDFSCPQHLLVSKMGYFADVTAGQRLEEMDISVHCDIQIFDWLMKWVKHSASSMELLPSPPTQQTPTTSTGPQLDGNNVVPILVSASFLQMEPLLLECLAFCHAHLSEVVRTSTNLACLNDAIVTRLAAMFTNLELEMVRDKKERVTPRLWTKLIQSLCEPEPEALRGHFYSMAGLFRCGRCQSCVTNTMKSYAACVPSNIRLNRWGQLISHHVRDVNWDVNTYIVQLFKELKSWRKVYWKLWGHCHYLYCCTCEAHFPVYQMNWCRFHPESPNFLGPVTEGRIAGPAGRYACCGQQAFRFETLPGPNGCQFREHSVLVETDRERAILAIVQLVSENYALCEQPPMRMQELAAAGDISPCWQGITLTPQRCRQGLLPQLHAETVNLKIGRRMRGNNSAYYFNSSSETDTTSTSEEDIRHSRNSLRGGNTLRMRNAENVDYTSSSDGCESEHTMRAPKKKKRGKRGRKRPTEISGRFWSGELSARSNQDHQRDFEEKVMKQVVAYVNKKTGSDQNVPQNPQPLGGTYVRLEAEWRDMLKQRRDHGTGVGAAVSGACNVGGNYSSANASSSYYSNAPKQKHK